MLPFAVQRNENVFSYQQPLLLIGSCFSDEIAKKVVNAGFTIESNPLGTIFHPLPIARFLENCSTNRMFPANHLIEKNGLFSSWESSTKIEFSKVEELEYYLEQVKDKWNNLLSTASHLFITFGTAWGYHIEDYGIVANCHKFPSADFEKCLTSADEITAVYHPLFERLHDRFPELNIVLTVSPVRHVRDGLIQNNRSKAELIRAAHELVSRFSFVNYFPSYELLIDVLRDYRFYDRDRVHPSEEAIDFVWEQLLSSFTTDETRKMVDKVERFRKMEQHRLQTSDPSKIEDWEKRLAAERQLLFSAISGLKLN